MKGQIAVVFACAVLVSIAAGYTGPPVKKSAARERPIRRVHNKHIFHKLGHQQTPAPEVEESEVSGKASPSAQPVENVALRGRASMSSLLAGSNSSTGYLGLAMNAIDGNLNPNASLGSCAHTDFEMSPWWRVDLLSSHKILYVTVTNTLTAPERMTGAELLIGNSLSNNGNDNPSCGTISYLPAGLSQTFQCNGMVGRYVNLITRGREDYLTPCEVEVFGHTEVPPLVCAE
ncbi:fucolectin-like [Ambystoma mexicanum]|uniref:fucolectin-like n=1 Tax=Ambystoma mexicanum TaxID=8296 RepID=UPI0037E951E3